MNLGGDENEKPLSGLFFCLELLSPSGMVEPPRVRAKRKSVMPVYPPQGFGTDQPKAETGIQGDRGGINEAKTGFPRARE